MKEVSSSSSSSSSWKSIAPEVARGDHLNQPKTILNNESSQSMVTGWGCCLRKDSAIPRIAAQQWPCRNTVGVFWIPGTKATCTKLVLLVMKTPNVSKQQFYYHQNHHCHALYIDAEQVHRSSVLQEVMVPSLTRKEVGKSSLTWNG